MQQSWPWKMYVKGYDEINGYLKKTKQSMAVAYCYV